MSPRLDMPLNRREAMTSLLAMLAFVMGVGALPDEAEAETEFPSIHDGNSLPPPVADYGIRGIYVGWDGDLEMNTQLDVADGAIRIGNPTSGDATIIRAIHPAARRFVDTVAAEMHKVGTAHAPIEREPGPPKEHPIERIDRNGLPAATHELHLAVLAGLHAGSNDGRATQMLFDAFMIQSELGCRKVLDTAMDITERRRSLIG